MRTWLIFAQRDNCRHADAINEIGYVNWYSKYINFEVGDIVYLYLSNIKGVKFMTEVVEIDVLRSDYDFWEKPTDKNFPTAKLEFRKEHFGSGLDEISLKKHGFNGGKSIEKPMCSNTELLAYIGEQFSGKSEFYLKHYLDDYINRWDFYNKYEGCKWDAFKMFASYFNDNSKAFNTRLELALSKADNLLTAANYFGSSMVIEFANNKPLQTELLFDKLFDESVDIRNRAVAYINGCKNLIKEMKVERYSDWYVRNNVKSFQDIHAISVYLSFRYPAKFYIYKKGIFVSFANKVNYKIKSNNHIDNFLEFEELCSKVKVQILMQREFLMRYNQWLNEKKYKDPNYNLLTQDFIYIVAMYADAIVKPKYKDKSLAVVEPEVVNVEELITFKSNRKQIFKPKKGIDYIKLDRLNHYLGSCGEAWVMALERKRLDKLNIHKEVKQISKEKGDGAGYDILSWEDDGITERYIEVKTTMGDYNQPFFFSDTEMDKSATVSAHYYTYRVYGFKSSDKPAYVLMIKGDLSKLNAKPKEFQVKLSNKK